MLAKIIKTTTFFSLINLVNLFAQNSSDALRLSYLQNGNGTARGMGVGGALGALGADYSATATNPAGLASFRTSEFSFSVGYFNAKSNSRLENLDTPNKVFSDNSSKFNLNNIAFVGSKRPNRGNWTTKNWSIGLNRQANFDGAFYYAGKSQGSIVSRFQEKANNNPKSLYEFEEGLAWEAGAIYHKNNDFSRYASDFDGKAFNEISKTQQGITEGRINELSFAYAANYKEKVQIGGAIGVPFMRYYDNKSYQESDPETATDLGVIPSFKELTWTENYGVTGTGVNAKLGMILKPIQSFRIGLSAQTPTRYNLSEAYSNSFRYNYIDEPKPGDLVEYDETADSPDGEFEYIVKTPWRFTASAALLLGKKGFISADVDVIDYSQMAFEFGLEDKDYQIEINQAIQDNFTKTANIRLGGEYVMDIFRIRAGVATLGLPNTFNSGNYWKDATKTYTLGLGMRERRFYLDVAYQYTRSSDIFAPYLVSSEYPQQVVNRTNNTGNLVATMGFKF